MEKRLNFWYGSIFGNYWMIYGIIASFSSVFLLARGYTNSQIGTTLALANILAVIMQPLVADVADRSKKVGPIGIPGIMTSMMMIFALGLFIFRPGGLAICVVFILLIAWHTVLQPMFNALTFKLEETGIPVNFGVARSVGSLAYSLLVAVTGTLVEKLGVMVLPALTEITCAMLIISLVLTWRTFKKAMEGRSTPPRRISPGDHAADTDHAADSDEAPARAEQEENIGLVLFIRRNRLFFILNLGVVGLFFSNSVLNSYMLQIVTNVGGSSEDMGRILGLMAFLEIPTMVFFSRIKNKVPCQLLLKIASVGFLLKILLHWLAGSVGMLYLAQSFQLIGFALFFPGMVYFIGEHMSRGEAVKGQALFTTMITVATIFASFFGGRILDLMGAGVLTLIATIATACGAAVIFLVVDRIGYNEN